MTCNECMHWNEITEKNGGEGYCIRYAPRPVVVGVTKEHLEDVIYSRIIWPILKGSAKCSEIQPTPDMSELLNDEPEKVIEGDPDDSDPVY